MSWARIHVVLKERGDLCSTYMPEWLDVSSSSREVSQ